MAVETTLHIIYILFHEKEVPKNKVKKNHKTIYVHCFYPFCLIAVFEKDLSFMFQNGKQMIYLLFSDKK